MKSTSGTRRTGNAPVADAVERWRTPARVGYVVVVMIATLSKLRIDPSSAAQAGERLQHVLTPTISPRDAVDGLRNVLLFAGWGLVWSLTARRGRALATVLLAAISGLLLSASVETVQLFSPRRQASLLDVLTNTTGALLGSIVTVAMLHALALRRTARSYTGMPMLLCALAYAAAATFEVVLPGMRQDLLVGASGGPVARFSFALARAEFSLSPLPVLLLQVLLLLPAGSLVTAALVEHGMSYRRAFLSCTTGGVLLSLLLEFGRGATGQPIEFDMFAAHALGIGTGAALTVRWLPALTRRLRGAARPLALLAAYALVLVLWRWRPFLLETDLAALRENFSLQPLSALALRADMFSASIVAVGFLLHVPIGGLLAVWPLRTTGVLAGALPGVLLVVAMEVGQIAVAGRFFDITDIIIGSAGVLTGYALVRRAGFTRRGVLLPPRAGGRTAAWTGRSARSR
jgi:VanZ family protein